MFKHLVLPLLLQYTYEDSREVDMSLELSREVKTRKVNVCENIKLEIIRSDEN